MLRNLDADRQVVTLAELERLLEVAQGDLERWIEHVPPARCPRALDPAKDGHGLILGRGKPGSGTTADVHHRGDVDDLQDDGQDASCRPRRPGLVVFPVPRVVGDLGGLRVVYHADQPPSTTRFAPVTYEEASEARNTTAPTNSDASAMRPIGIRAEYASTNSAGWSFATPASVTVFTRTPLVAQ